MATGRSGYSGVSGAGRLISHLGTFVMVSALAGVLIAGLTLPFVGSVGLTAKAASDHFEDLPNDFESPVLPQRTKILADDGSVIASTWGDYGNRVVVPMSQINANMPHALVAIEDIRFYQHGGVDLKGTVRALVNNSEGGGTQGGSSITQQYVKNVLLLEAGTNKTKQQAAIADTFSRKLTELKYAIAVEKTLSKDQILERYLNLVYFGNSAYGVESAAERYFSTTSSKLTVPQAALLAAVVNSPVEFDPFAHPQQALQRRNIVLADMANPALNYITPAQAKQYEKAPLGLKPTTPHAGCITARASAAFFCNYVYESFLQSSTYGKTKADRQAMWNEGGLTLRTTMSVKDETSADAAISKRVYGTDLTNHKVGSALVMVQPGTGQIKAMAQSARMGSGKGQTYINLSADPAHNGTTGFQAGSSFKIFVGLAALEQGVNPNQVIDAPATVDDVGTKVPVCAGNQTSITWPKDVPASGKYAPSNDDHADHQTAMPEAYAASINTYFLRMEEQTGLCKPAQVAEAMGVTQDNDNGTGKSLQQVLAFTLGVNPMTPIEMASAYATLAAQGTYCTPYVITQVTDVSGKNYGGQPQSCRQVIDANIANQMTSMLQGVLDHGTAAGQSIITMRQAAGKTGTTDSGIATWFDGYTPQLAAATWTGFVDFGSKSKLANIKLGPTYWSGQIFGASISAPTWNDAMNGALAGVPAQQFTPPVGFTTPNAHNPPPQGGGTGGTPGFLGGLLGGGGGNGGHGH